MLERGKTIYIAGKITGDADYKAKFQRAREQLEARGYIVMDPSVLPDGFAYEAYMRITGAMLAECDGICLLPDWTESEGAKREREQAIKAGKTVLHAYDLNKTIYECIRTLIDEA